MIFVKNDLYNSSLGETLIFLIHLKGFVKNHKLNDVFKKIDEDKTEYFLREKNSNYKSFYLEKHLPGMEKGKRFWINSNDYISITEFGLYDYNNLVTSFNNNFPLVQFGHFYSPFNNIGEILSDLYKQFDSLKTKYVLNQSFNSYHPKAVYINNILFRVNENFEFKFIIDYGYKNDGGWEIEFETGERKIDLALIKFFDYLKTITKEKI